MGLRELTYIAPIYASAAEDITVFMICARLSTAPLLGGKETSSEMKNSTSMASCLEFAELGDVAVACENHIGRFIDKYGLFL